MVVSRHAGIAGILLAAALHAAMIRPGVVLDIQVQSHPELSGRYAVSASGLIEYPLLADISVANISTSELMNDLTLRLAKHIDNPLVMVSIVEKPEISVTLLGHIGKPGPCITYQGVTLQEALQSAGGPGPGADLQRIKIVRKGSEDREAEFFDLEAFMTGGTVELMPRLQDGDVVVLLSSRRSSKVKVIGAVARPGFFDLQEPVNIFEIIYMAGGPAEKADLSRVRRFFKNDGKSMEEILDIQASIDKGAMDDIPLVHEGDVIIVYTKWFDWKTVLTVLNNTLLFIVTIQAFSGILSK